MNNAALSLDLGRLVYAHIAARPNDKFIIGSIAKTVIYNLPISYLEITPLSRPHVEKYALVNGVRLSQAQVDNLMKISHGLPIYLEIALSTANGKEYGFALKSNMREIIYGSIIPCLSADAKKLMLLLAFFSITKTEFCIPDIEAAFDAYPHGAIDELRRYSLLISYSNSYYKMHDRIRDILVDDHAMESSETNEKIFRYYKQQNNIRAATLHLLLAHESAWDIRYLINSINEQLRQTNLPFLYQSYEAVRKKLKSNRELLGMILYSHLYSTMGIGAYLDARNFVESVLLGARSLPDIRALNSEFEFRIHFLIRKQLPLFKCCFQLPKANYRFHHSKRSAIGALLIPCATKEKLSTNP